jgi:hypothetical protein
LLSLAGVSKVPSPVAGYNSNVRHRGADFHLQTEDSGVKNPRIVSHLFADGGRILRTLRIDYREQLGRADLADYVREQMRAQHKALYLSLRRGELDPLIEGACGPLSLPPSRLPTSQFSLPPGLASLPSRSLTPTRRHAVQPGLEEPSAVHVLPVPEVVQQRSSRGERPVQMRPPARSAALPIPQFQPDEAVSEKSLDDLILSRVSEELEAPSK